MAYAFGQTDLIKLLKTAFSASVGHDHDGSNSKAVANGVTLAGTQTLTNKTITSPTITGGTSTSKSVVTAYAADGAIAIGSGVAGLTKGSAGAYTLAAPAAGDDGTVLHIVAGTDYAHVVTIASTSLLDGTNTPKGTCTTAAYIGSGITVVAVGQKWLLRSNVAATLAAS